MNKNLLTALGVIVILIVGFFVLNNYIYNEKQADDIDASISSYEECVAGGYPSMESYPEQCVTADGKHFVRVLSDEELVNISSETTMRGTVVCLPHWDTSGPQTLECAIGLMSEGGSYYTLRDADPSDSGLAFAAPAGVTVEVSGTLIPGSDEKYQSIGTIEVESINLIEEEIINNSFSMKGFKGDIEKLTEDNENFRQVLYTAKNSQLVLMSLKSGEDIGEERHQNDQFFRVEQGEGRVIIDGTEYQIKDDDAVIVPAGALHNVINTHESESLKVYTIYSPPHHKDGTVHATKQEAMADDEEFDGQTTE